MKSAIAMLLLCGIMVNAAEPDLTVRLSSCRSEFRTHDSTDKPGLIVRLQLIPAAGISLCDTEKLNPNLTVTDASGKKHKATAARIYRTEDDTQQIFAEYTIAKRPTGAKLQADGTLELTTAKDLVLHEPISVNLLAASEFKLGETTFTVTPAEANANKNNMEGERLRRAEITITYPAATTIMQISRCWLSEPQEGAESTESFTQELQFTTKLNDDATKKSTTLIIVDALHTPSLQISTCAEKNKIKQAFHFELTLSEVVEITPSAEAEQKQSKQP
ncbi:MAG: hypothetical protein Q4A24_00520 [Akkermansia sp.]|nr:hypothetical protein [Akkermansia sp.]